MAGFTLIELLISVSIIVVLASTMFGLTGALRSRAEAAGCIANMKSLFAGLAAYTNDYKRWPQPPQDVLGDEDKFYDFWVASLEEYDITRETWVCPTSRRLQSAGGIEKKDWAGTYTPAGFEPSSPMVPYRWGNQPWLAETTDHHGKGAYLLFPDGSIRTMETVLGTGEKR